MANPYSNQQNSQSYSYAAQQSQCQCHTSYSYISKFGDIGQIEHSNNSNNIEIFGTRIDEKEFNKINSKNALLLQYDGKMFKVDGKEIYIDDIESLGKTLVSIFARRNLLDE